LSLRLASGHPYPIITIHSVWLNHHAVSIEENARSDSVYFLRSPSGRRRRVEEATRECAGLETRGPILVVRDLRKCGARISSDM
jgi:hypothetical protein